MHYLHATNCMPFGMTDIAPASSTNFCRVVVKSKPQLTYFYDVNNTTYVRKKHCHFISRPTHERQLVK